MPYEWTEIENVWLRESHVTMSPNRMVDGFNSAVRHLGMEWVERHRIRDGIEMSGASTALPVAVTGLKIREVENSVGFAELLTRLRKGDRAAYFELSASYLCIRGRNEVRLEFGIEVPVGTRTRRPDFRLAVEGDPWTHVEVTAPSTSEATNRANSLLQAIAERLMALPANTTIEALILREPSIEE